MKSYAYEQQLPPRQAMIHLFGLLLYKGLQKQQYRKGQLH
jgi:hypothetical protein